MGLFSKDTSSTPSDDPTSPGVSGTVVPTGEPGARLAPSDPQEQQEFLQSLVAEVTEQHSGEDLDTVAAALAARIDASGLPPQPTKWVEDTASEIAEGRHVVVDRHLAVSNGPGSHEVPIEARDSSA